MHFNGLLFYGVQSLKDHSPIICSANEQVKIIFGPNYKGGFQRTFYLYETFKPTLYCQDMKYDYGRFTQS